MSAGRFHKTLPHDEYGEVDPGAFAELLQRLKDGGDLESLPRGRSDAVPLVNPLAGLGVAGQGVAPPPVFTSISAAAELTELYWMALARDVSLDHLTHEHPLVQGALADLSDLFARAVVERSPGALKVGADVPGGARGVDIRVATLFRCGLLGEDAGPLVSQFLLHDFETAGQVTVRKLHPYAPHVDHLGDHTSWLAAQDGAPAPRELPPPRGAWRRAGTMRDLARFEGLAHQPFADALSLLKAWGARANPGNPYRGLERTKAHATLGAPHAAALLAEAAGRAMRLAAREQWQVHLRGRPETLAGLAHMQRHGLSRVTRDHGLPGCLFETGAAARISARGAWFLPIARPGGASAHPSYPGAHATVAGACATVLKAWFDESQTFEELIDGARHPLTGHAVRVVAPGLQPHGPPDGTGGCEHAPYRGDIARMTVGGELNKLAANTGMSRAMAGLHFRSDNTRGLRLGERVALQVLGEMAARVPEKGLRLAFTSFERHVIEVDASGVRQDGARFEP